MRFVVVLDMDDSLLDGDDTIENACRVANENLDRGDQGTVPPTVRPLSEIISC